MSLKREFQTGDEALQTVYERLRPQKATDEQKPRSGPGTTTVETLQSPRETRSKRRVREFSFPRKRFLVLAALGLLGTPWLPHRATPVAIVPTRSANALYNTEGKRYRAELSTLLGQTAQDRTKTLKEHPWPESLADPSAFVTIEQSRRHRDAMRRHLTVLKQGLTLPMTEVSWNQETNSIPLNLVYLRELARLRVRDGNLKLHDGDASGAMTAYLDTYALGNQVMQGRSLVCGMIGVLCQGIAVVSAPEALSGLSAKEARAAIQRFETILSQQLPFDELLKKERQEASGSAELNLLGTDAFWENAPAFRLVKSYLTTRVKDAMDHAIVQTRLPYQKNQGVLTAETESRDIATLLHVGVIPNVNRAFHSYTARTAQARRVLLLLAVRAWQAERGGTLPPRLDALVAEGYLKQLPSDPLSTDGITAFRYDSKTGAVWSVGFDGKDDHGQGDDNGQP